MTPRQSLLRTTTQAGPCLAGLMVNRFAGRLASGVQGSAVDPAEGCLGGFSSLTSAGPSGSASFPFSARSPSAKSKAVEPSNFHIVNCPRSASSMPSLRVSNEVEPRIGEPRDVGNHTQDRGKLSRAHG